MTQAASPTATSRVSKANTSNKNLKKKNERAKKKFRQSKPPRLDVHLRSLTPTQAPPRIFFLLLSNGEAMEASHSLPRHSLKIRASLSS